MATPDPGLPFQHLLADLMKVIGGANPSWFEAAAALAQTVADEGVESPNPDPLLRIELEELTRLAHFHASARPGLPDIPPVTFIPVTPGAFARHLLLAWRPLAEPLVAAASATLEGNLPSDPDALPDLDEPSPLGIPPGLLGQFASVIGPSLVGLQLGSAVGHLARASLGSHPLPLPPPPGDELPLAGANLLAFAEDWSLPPDEVKLWVAIYGVVSHAVLASPPLAERLRSLLAAGTASAVEAQSQLLEKLSGGDLETFLADPTALVTDLEITPSTSASLELTAAVCAIRGAIDYHATALAKTLIGSSSTIPEAWRRHLTAVEPTQQGAGALFGLDCSLVGLDRGVDFIRGVVERAGDDALLPLFTDPAGSGLPTPAELDAPGLWLARLDLTKSDPEGPPSSDR